MIELKCKMCGGNLKTVDNSNYATCEYCGSMFFLSNMDNPIEKDKKISFEELLNNARKSVNKKNWLNIEKYYRLVEEESDKNTTIEATFFIAVAKVISDKSLDNYQKRNSLNNALEVIEQYYDVTEDREEVLCLINDFLFKMSFPQGQVEYSSYNTLVFNSLFYGVIVSFTKKLEILSKKYYDEFLHSLISKNRQIIIIVNSERKNFYKPVIIFAFFMFLIMSIVGTVFYFYFVSVNISIGASVFILAIIPCICTIITGFVWSKMANNVKENVSS